MSDRRSVIVSAIYAEFLTFTSCASGNRTELIAILVSNPNTSGAGNLALTAAQRTEDAGANILERCRAAPNCENLIESLALLSAGVSILRVIWSAC